MSIQTSLFVSESLNFTSPILGNTNSLLSVILRQTRSCLLAAILICCSKGLLLIKSEIKKDVVLFFIALVRKRRPSPISVPLCCGLNVTISLIIRKIWL